VKVFKIVGSAENQLGSAITSFPDKTSYHLNQQITDITENCKVKVTVDNGMENSRTLTINYTPPLPEFGDINEWPDLLLGSLSHSGTEGASCASIDGSVYEIAEARTNSGKVDFVYWNGASNPNSIAAPSNTTLGQITAMQSGWTTKNETKLQRLTTITADEFDEMENDAEIDELVTDTTVTEDIVTNLKVDDIIGFITAGGKKGLMKVNSVGTPANHVNISIKVQE
jgi:hypothetical protein